MIAPALFSTGKDDWETPPELFAALHREFSFTLDLAANAANAKCPRWIGPGGIASDLLAYDIADDEVYWMNPPYSSVQTRFIQVAANAAIHKNVTVVALLPARTDTRKFHDFIWDRDRHASRPWVREVRFLKGRLRFVGAPSWAPFPSMIVIFKR